MAKYIWNILTTESTKTEKNDSVKLAKELIFKDRPPQEIISIFSDLEKELKIMLYKIEQKNELENKAINNYLNPIKFKDRAQEIKAKYNHSFKNLNSKQEYAKC